MAPGHATSFQPSSTSSLAAWGSGGSWPCWPGRQLTLDGEDEGARGLPRRIPDLAAVHALVRHLRRERHLMPCSGGGAWAPPQHPGLRDLQSRDPPQTANPAWAARGHGGLWPFPRASGGPGRRRAQAHLPVQLELAGGAQGAFPEEGPTVHGRPSRVSDHTRREGPWDRLLQPQTASQEDLEKLLVLGNQGRWQGTDLLKGIPEPGRARAGV